jgi:hypothetical protein
VGLDRGRRGLVLEGRCFWGVISGRVTCLVDGEHWRRIQYSMPSPAVMRRDYLHAGCLIKHSSASIRQVDTGDGSPLCCPRSESHRLRPDLRTASLRVQWTVHMTSRRIAQHSQPAGCALEIDCILVLQDHCNHSVHIPTTKTISTSPGTHQRTYIQMYKMGDTTFESRGRQ